MVSDKTALLNLENELLITGRKLNDLIYESRIAGRMPGAQTPADEGLYQDKIDHLEAHLRYLQGQLDALKGLQAEPKPQEMPVLQREQTPQEMSAPRPTPAPRPAPAPEENSRKYEKLFGKNFMGVFASILIFISLIIFATLVLPYLNDTMKLTGLYLLSAVVLGAGLLLHRRHRENKFFVAIIGCGMGCLYLTLLLSNLYFKVIGDIALYCLILIWAILARSLTRVKNLVFLIIGQAGIFIATILGTILCVADADAKKFLVLTVFYLISAGVFSQIDKDYLHALIHSHRGRGDGEAACEPPRYEKRLCSHICVSLNVFVFTVGFLIMDADGCKTAAVLLLMLFMLCEFGLSFPEKCRSGVGFQFLTVIDSLLLILLFHAARLLEGQYTYVFMYLTAIALLFYVKKKDAGVKPISQVWGLLLVFVGCCGNRWMREHLYAYLTAIPFLAFGRWKKERLYQYAGVVYLFGMWFLLPGTGDSFSRIGEVFLMTAASYAVFLAASRRYEETCFKVLGYIMLGILTAGAAYLFSYKVLATIYPSDTATLLSLRDEAVLIAFYTVAALHLLFTKIGFFGEKAAVKVTMLGLNAVLMCIGLVFLHGMPWLICTILVTVLLFVVNSKELLHRHRNVGYYVAFKYTVLMANILGAFDAVNYVVSICLLVFAVVSIIAGFHKDNAAFRLYGLILSMVSVIKLILVDVNYDSTLENAISFFVCGVLCFVISFIYHKIDVGFKNK